MIFFRPRFFYKKYRPNRLWAALLSICLIAPPAQASIFDPLINWVAPIYNKIVGNNESEIIAPSESPTQAILTTTPTPQRLYITPTSPTHTKSPDLATVMLAEFAYSRGKPNVALQLYKDQALKPHNTANVFERALEISMQQDNSENSFTFAKQWQEKNPEYRPAWFYTTHLALREEEYAIVSQNLQRILDDNPKADLSKIFEGILPQTLVAQQALYQELKSLNHKNNASLAVLKAGLLAQMGENLPAILYLSNAIEQEPDNLAYYLLKADILKNSKEFFLRSDLIRFLSDSQKHTQGNTQKQLYLYQVRHHINQNELPQTWQLLKRIYPKYQNDSEFSMLTALVALDVQAYDHAQTILTILADNPTRQSEANYYLGISYERSGQPQKALQAYQQVNNMQFAWLATEKIVALLLNQNNPAGAINALENLRNRFEMYASNSYTLQADILLKLGKKQDAQALLEQAYQNYPDDSELLYASTRLLDDVEDFEQKKQNLENLLILEPDNLTYQLDLASVNLANNPDDPESLKTALFVNELTPNDDRYDSDLHLQALQLLANYALYQKNYSAVIDYLELPYQLSPELAIGISLLRAYQGLGNHHAVQTLIQDLQQRFGQESPTTHELPQ